MGDLLQSLVDAVRDNEHLAYLLVCALAFSESLPVLGSIIPGTTIILGIAAFVPSGAIDLGWLLASAILGAIGGDWFSYWLGFRYRMAIKRLWPLSHYPQLLEKGQEFVERHGAKSIFIARFTPAVRAVVPLVAGILHMEPRRFYTVNVVSAVAWAVAHIVPAVIAGASLAVAGAVGGRLLGLIVVLLILLWLIVVVMRLVIRRGLPLLGRGTVRLWLWARHHDNWVSREILSLLDPSHHEAKGLLLLVVLLVSAAWAFAAIFGQAVAGDPLLRADQATFNFLQGLRTLWGDRTMVVLTELGDPVVTGAIVVAVALWLAARRAWRATCYWLGAVAFTLAFIAAARLAIPANQAVPLIGSPAASGFPFGQTAVTATVYGFLALLVGRELGMRGRGLLTMAIALLFALVTVSRLYLGVHLVSDVLAGLAFGIAWIAGLGIVYLSHRPQPVRAGGMFAFAGLAFLVVGTFHVTDRYHAEARRYVAHLELRHMPAVAWWQQGWASLPPRRIDLAGRLEEPITLQWAGTLSALEARLAAKGWVAPPPWTFTSTLAWLAPEADPEDLPVLPRLHDGRPTRLILIEPASDGKGRPTRLILRVWRSNVLLDNGEGAPYPLWIGAVAVQRLYHVGSFLTFGMSMRDENAARERLEMALAPVRVVERKAEPDPWAWNGWVLLAHDPSISLPDPEKRVEP
ncbi:MAG TPA: VTT domain-containing protein [Alphaproteobacteria bacterium]|nr:VTT domain-containing protein [Alphaproteobacteria bacterium]